MNALLDRFLNHNSPFVKWSTAKPKFDNAFSILKTNKNDIKAISHSLHEILPFIEQSKFDYNNEDATVLRTVRETYLQLWKKLLDLASTLAPNDYHLILKIFVALMKRKEFDYNQLKDKKPQTIQIASVYRSLLFQTQCFVETELSESKKKAHSSANKQSFLSNVPSYQLFTQIFAINYFRLTTISHRFICSIAPTQEESQAYRSYIEDFQSVYSPDCPQQEDKFSKDFPNLAGWIQFNNSFKSGSDEENEKIRDAPEDWMEELKKKDILFHLFVQEWICYVRSESKDPYHIKWYSIRDFKHLVRAFLISMLKNESGGCFSRFLTDCSIEILLCDPTLLNFYLHIVFDRTNVYDLLSVIEVLNLIDTWFRELSENGSKLDSNFDVEYFCKACQIIIDIDHHQLILRLLTILYKYSDIFVGNARRYLFAEFLLNQNFYGLFLHWESSIRNTFQQILVFKALTVKRSVLGEKGFLVNELSRSSPHKMETPRHKSSSEITNSDLDDLLFGRIEFLCLELLHQLRSTEKKYPVGLEVYVPKAVSEYKKYLSMYYQWEDEPQNTGIRKYALIPLPPEQEYSHLLKPADKQQLGTE
eukprot:TRINITY_DN5353_c0_g1_i1.p1 TRINITY_DN5353_c0_g1~~TRINITY_DN5353_c0_g1_i1.p1  ORF type:complete len:590 (+),score=97.42 TRINITY_DN5353_c0_g1_i1:41-1810(+)